MPVINDTPSTPPDPRQNPIKVTPPRYESTVVDTRYTPSTSLMTNVEGASWIVEYYSQVLAKDSALSGQNLDRDAVYQSYRLIKQFELKVTTPLSQTQDTASKAFTLTGMSNMYPCGVIPNEGDMFLASIGDGRTGVFRITSSEQRSIYKDTGWIVDYLLIGYVDQARLDDLAEKTVETLVFIKDFLTHGQDPLILQSEYLVLQKLNSGYDELVNEYLRRFVSNEYRTLVAPGQLSPVYDPFLTKAVLSAFSDSQSPHFQKLRELNVSGDDAMDRFTIWDALLTKNRARLRGAVWLMGLRTAKNFSKNPAMDSVRYSGVDYVVYPKDGERSQDDLRQKASMATAEAVLVTSPSQMTRLIDMLTVSVLDGLPGASIPAINANTEFYVFSEAFYQRYSVGLSALEIQATQFLEDHPLNVNTLLALMVSSLAWPPLEQFYQIPVLLMLIKSVVRRM